MNTVALDIKAWWDICVRNDCPYMGSDTVGRHDQQYPLHVSNIHFDNWPTGKGGGQNRPGSQHPGFALQCWFCPTASRVCLTASTLPHRIQGLHPCPGFVPLCPRFASMSRFCLTASRVCPTAPRFVSLHWLFTFVQNKNQYATLPDVCGQ